MAAPARRRLAAAVRPVVRRPGAVAADGRRRLAWRSRTCRPSTGATVFYDDVVGSSAPAGQRRSSAGARRARRIVPRARREWRDDLPVREEADPGRPAAGGPSRCSPGRPTWRRCGRPAGSSSTTSRPPTTSARWSRRGEFPAPGAPTGLRGAAPRGWGTASCGSTPRARSCTPAPTPSRLPPARVVGRPGRAVAGRDVTAGLIGQRRTVDESMPLVLTGRAPWRVDVEARGAALVAAGGAADRGTASGSARCCCCRDVVGAAAPRARADHQGRDDPRDPPPREEQPADGRRAAAAAVPAGRLAERPRRRSGRPCAGWRTIALVHETLSQGSTRRVASTTSSARPAARRGRGDRGSARAHAGARVVRVGCAPRTPPRWP